MPILGQVRLEIVKECPVGLELSVRARNGKKATLKIRRKKTLIFLPLIPKIFIKQFVIQLMEAENSKNV